MTDYFTLNYETEIEELQKNELSRNAVIAAKFHWLAKMQIKFNI